MNYLVTGATGFIGRFLVARLLQRANAQVHVLVRPPSEARWQALRQRMGEGSSRLHVIWGDLSQPGLFTDTTSAALPARIQHVFHLAALYDMTASEADAQRVNVDGTRALVNFVNALPGTVRLHHMSSVAVAGAGWRGRFGEEHFDEGQTLDHPYYRSKFEAERIVRSECRQPFRIYRPGIVVGSSISGEIDKIDGPYYFFKALQRVSTRMPKWVPLLGVHGGPIPLCPVDYVAGAVDHLAHRRSLDGGCFHLVQSTAPTVGDLLERFLRIAQGPAVRLRVPRLPAAVLDWGEALGRHLTGHLPPPLSEGLAARIGVPMPVLSYAFNRMQVDDQATRKALGSKGPQCPDIADYAEALWRYWELFLDIEAAPAPQVWRRLRGRTVLITGASSGIGFHTARRLALAGARVILVARSVEKLEQTRAVIAKLGGEAHVHPCDLTDLEAIDQLCAQLIARYGEIDVLINNAGRSIRRSVCESQRRFHDFQRTMQLNYFGAVRLIMNLLPGMIERRDGHIINISSIGVLANAARFSAYVASKAALDAFTRCLSAEVRGHQVHTTAIYMPLVRTPMIAPTKVYDYVPAWSPDDAVDAIVRAIVERPKSISTPLGTVAAVSYAMWPKLNDYILNLGFRLFPGTTHALRGQRAHHRPTLEQAVYAPLFKDGLW